MGVQLGHGHPRGLGGAFQAELRTRLRRFLVEREAAPWEVSGRLAGALWSAWRELR